MPPPHQQTSQGLSYRAIILGTALMLLIPILYMRSVISTPTAEPGLRPQPRVVQSQPKAADLVQVQQEPKKELVGRTLPPKQDRPREHIEILAEWNQVYHKKRQDLRDEQERDGTGPLEVHTFYTMDCTYHSLWQVMTLENSWEEVNQGGFITRVISGCDKLQHKQEKMMHFTFENAETEKRAGSFFAPTFSTLPSGEYYAPYNRPNGIWYWLNHSDITEDVLVLLDPDMFYIKKLNAHSLVRPGHPAAQFYGYMVMDFARYQCDICPKRGTFKNEDYQVGPPWLINADDLRRMMSRWVALVPAIRKIDPTVWIVEMIAYSVAAAAENLPHSIIWDGMVDNIGQARVWDPVTNQLKTNEADKPALIHYCFTWEVGETPPKNQQGGEEQHQRMTKREFANKAPVIDYYHWSKYRMPTDWPGGKPSYRHNLFDCAAPLLQEFHSLEALPKDDSRAWHQWKRTAQFLELTLPRINTMLTRYKKRYCTDPAKINLQKQLRTSHPRYWLSRYEITDYRDGRSVDFKLANMTLSGIEPHRVDG